MQYYFLLLSISPTLWDLSMNIKAKATIKETDRDVWTVCDALPHTFDVVFKFLFIFLFFYLSWYRT